MRYEKVWFNVQSVLMFNSGEEFSEHKSYQHLWPGLPEEKRKERLKDVYKLCKLSETF